MAPNIHAFKFKNRLKSYKSDYINIDSKNPRPVNYWELSNVVLGRIEGPSYVGNKKGQKEVYQCKLDISGSISRYSFLYQSKV